MQRVLQAGLGHGHSQTCLGDQHNTCVMCLVALLLCAGVLHRTAGCLFPSLRSAKWLLPLLLAQACCAGHTRFYSAVCWPAQHGAQHNAEPGQCPCMGLMRCRQSGIC